MSATILQLRKQVAIPEADGQLGFSKPVVLKESTNYKELEAERKELRDAAVAGGYAETVIYWITAKPPERVGVSSVENYYDKRGVRA